MVPRKNTANQVFGSILFSFLISFLPLNQSEMGQYSINRKYRLHNQLAILHNISSNNLFKNSRKKNSLWPHFLHPKWQACWPMPYNLPKLFLSSIAKEVFILFQKSTSRASGCTVSCSGYIKLEIQPERNQTCHRHLDMIFHYRSYLEML